MYLDSWRSGKGQQHCYAKSLLCPYHNPGNIPGVGRHAPGEAVAPADLCGWNEVGQGCEGRAATPLGETRWAGIILALNLKGWPWPFATPATRSSCCLLSATFATSAATGELWLDYPCKECLQIKREKKKKKVDWSWLWEPLKLASWALGLTWEGKAENLWGKGSSLFQSMFYG